jgi:hypothetical protein
MDRLSRILAIVLLAMFAAGTVAHGARATSMSLAMSHDALAGGGMAGGDMAGEDMGDCDGCPPGDDGKVPLCSQFCLAPFAALPVAVGVELSIVAAETAASPLNEMVGRTGPPDPSPPRTIIL